MDQQIRLNMHSQCFSLMGINLIVEHKQHKFSENNQFKNTRHKILEVERPRKDIIRTYKWYYLNESAIYHRAVMIQIYGILRKSQLSHALVES